jgi:hypothetical protein
VNLQITQFLTIQIRRSGLAFVARVEMFPLEARVEAVLTLRWIEVAIISFLLALGAAAFNFRAEIAHTWLIATWAASNKSAAALLIAGSVFVLGWILALWKKKQLFTYGITEISFALLTAFQIGLSLWPEGDLSKFVGLGSTLYVASRGAGNLWDAFVTEAEKTSLPRRLKVTMDLGKLA